MEEKNTVPAEQNVPVSGDSYKKASPFADSPYYGYYDQQEQAHPEVKVKKHHASGKRNGSRLMAALLAVILMVTSCGATAIGLNTYWQKRYDTFTAAMNNKLDVLQKQLDASPTGGTYEGLINVPVEGLRPADIFAQYANSVVIISSEKGTGTGFIISENGYIVSNHHVIADATALRVIMYDGTRYDAKVIGFDESNDVSVLKIEATGLKPVTIGSSDSLRVGDQVVAIGNALGALTSSLTVGYISGKDRIVRTDGSSINMLQTDAAINSGNSGGPLFNMKGEVVGINTAKYSGKFASGSYIEGIGFAIPIDDVVDMIADIGMFGHVVRPYMGVTVRDISAEVLENYGFPAGVYVDGVVEGLGADLAGVQPKDIIINLGGYSVASVADLDRVLRKFNPNDTTTVTVFRGGTQVDLTITLGEKPVEEPTQPQLPEQPNQSQQYPWWYEYIDPFFGGND